MGFLSPFERVAEDVAVLMLRVLDESAFQNHVWIALQGEEHKIPYFRGNFRLEGCHYIVEPGLVSGKLFGWEKVAFT